MWHGLMKMGLYYRFLYALKWLLRKLLLLRLLRLTINLGMENRLTATISSFQPRRRLFS